MKKILCSALLVAMLLCSVASAKVPSLGENMLPYAKAALGALASGAYDKLVTSLPYSDVSPSADEWESFAEGSFIDLPSMPQNIYAVAYWSGQVWKLAVPVSEPSDGDVEALVLLSQDGNSFSGYGCALWRDVRNEYQTAKYVLWDEEYNASTAALVESDE